MGQLLRQIRARRLDRLAAAYAVGAWILVQGASILLPTFAAPLWALRLVIMATIVGLPVVLAAGWVLVPVLRPDGVLSARHFAVLLAIGVASATTLSAIGYFTWRTDANNSPASATESRIQPEPNSIAVLPFVNMSGDPRREYFSDGISEELLNDLANTPQLRVAARTSSFAFKGHTANIAEIARALDVRVVLEGSVREAGNRVRITAQLVDAAGNYNLWSATYDRELTDILNVQSDIAKAITQALANKLVPRRARTQSARIDPETYRLYLQARSLFHRGNEDDLRKAADLLGAVTTHAPDYGEGFAALSAVQRTLVDRYSRTEFRMPAETAAREAVSLDAGNIEALSSLTNLLLDRWQWKEALDTFQKTQDARSGSSEALHLRSIVAFTFNYPNEDINSEKKASELDPLQPKLKYGMALWYWNNKRYEEGATAIRQVLQLRHGKYQDLDQQCAIEVGLGHLDVARHAIATLLNYYKDSPQNAMNCPFYLAFADKDIARARALTDAAATDVDANGGSFVTIGDAYRQIGDLRKAMPWYERAYEARDTLLFLVPTEAWQTPEPLVSYPPWKTLWSRQPVRDWEAAQARAGKQLSVTH
jgi:TolB-like protein